MASKIWLIRGDRGRINPDKHFLALFMVYDPYSMSDSCLLIVTKHWQYKMRALKLLLLIVDPRSKPPLGHVRGSLGWMWGFLSPILMYNGGGYSSQSTTGILTSFRLALYIRNVFGLRFLNSVYETWLWKDCRVS